MRLAGIVVEMPHFYLGTGMLDRQEPIFVEAFVAEVIVEGFHVAIVYWLARPTKVQNDTVAVGSEFVSKVLDHFSAQKRKLQSPLDKSSGQRQSLCSLTTALGSDR